LSAGSFDPQTAGPGAWFDVTTHISDQPGPAAGWFSGYYLQPPLAVSGVVIFIAAEGYTTAPVVAVSPTSHPIGVWIPGVVIQGASDASEPVAPSAHETEPIR